MERTDIHITSQELSRQTAQAQSRRHTRSISASPPQPAPFKPVYQSCLDLSSIPDAAVRAYAFPMPRKSRIRIPPWQSPSLGADIDAMIYELSLKMASEPFVVYSSKSVASFIPTTTFLRLPSKHEGRDREGRSKSRPSSGGPAASSHRASPQPHASSKTASPVMQASTPKNTNFHAHKSSDGTSANKIVTSISSHKKMMASRIDPAAAACSSINANNHHLSMAVDRNHSEPPAASPLSKPVTRTPGSTDGDANKKRKRSQNADSRSRDSGDVSSPEYSPGDAAADMKRSRSGD
ncbi:hypothetical protein SeLEV6574_g05645 [Synchytrium endobioticum]|uniref:Uncharacterized protein n=1 Tax=Synchytrium endobioticum TaxID=286115 RepID=A0A507CT61_9FUNG|nr:hypothetical protein SeLEV6574_g05645 [Synchytrium endobioticum]